MLAAELENYMRGFADPAKAAPMEAYMRGQFVFLGIKAPDRTKYVRSFIQEHGLPKDKLLETAEYLWALPEREFHYAAIELLGKYGRYADAMHIDLLEKWIVEQSWWDTVDSLAAHHVGDFFKRFPDLIPAYTERWIHSNNMWLRRTAILYQLRYKERTDVNRLFSFIVICKDEEEFFIRKAIGWALREYGKTDGDAVRRFVDRTTLSPLSIREALKHL